jgi:hypothetical protein
MTKRYCFCQDDESHHYLLPVELQDGFYELRGAISQAEFDSDARWELEDRFEDKFSEYRLAVSLWNVTFSNPQIDGEDVVAYD